MARKNPKALERLNSLVEQMTAQRVHFDGQTAEDYPSLREQACLVTGGASGFGKAFTEALASNGAYVAFTDLDQASGLAIESQQKAAGRNVKFIHVDVTDWDSQVAGLKEAIKQSPKQRIDHFIANAGVEGHKLSNHLARAPRASHSSNPPRPNFGAINVSLIGGYYTLCLASHHFTTSAEHDASPAADRSITLLGSMSSYRSIPVGTDYAAAKFGTRGLFTAARETFLNFSKVDIRVNMLSPQFVETQMNTHSRQWYERAGYRFGDIANVSKALLRIVGDRTVRGRSISVNADRIHDLCDDVSGGDGWLEVQKLLQEGLLPPWNH